jgi:hypothetical protein
MESSPIMMKQLLNDFVSDQSRLSRKTGRDPMHILLWLCAALCLATSGLLIVSKVSADEKKEPPIIKAIAPLGVVDGMVVSLTVRGFRLREITGLKFPDLKTAPVVKILSKGAAPQASRVSCEKIGDTQVEFELLLPVDTPPGATTFIVFGPHGQSEARKLMVLDSRKSISEKEPNDGFSEAQDVSLGHTITGVLSKSADRDTYVFSGESGQRVRIEVQAAQLGSLLDPFVLIHNADGQLVMEMDKGPSGPDPILEMTLPKAGRYFISIRDAKDSSSPMHAYLVRTRAR